MRLLQLPHFGLVVLVATAAAQGTEVLCPCGTKAPVNPVMTESAFTLPHSVATDSTFDTQAFSFITKFTLAADHDCASSARHVIFQR